ncbi:MAG: hypothetical protein ABI261_09285 [Ginsengibacter sp.]
MKIIFSLFLFLTFLNLSAQKTNKKFSGLIFIDAGIPTGLFSSVYSFTGGISAGAKYSLTSQTSFSATAGFLNFFRKGGGEGISYIPVLGGFQFHFIPEAFVSFEAGAAIPTYANGGILACVIPAVGYQLNPRMTVDLNYTGIAQYGFLVGGINARFSYSF